MMTRVMLTELDRREVTLWRVYARWEDAKARGDQAAEASLEAGFRKRLADYEAAWNAEVPA